MCYRKSNPGKALEESAQPLTSVLQPWHSWIHLRCRESGDVWRWWRQLWQAADAPPGVGCWSTVSAVGESGGGVPEGHCGEMERGRGVGGSSLERQRQRQAGPALMLPLCSSPRWSSGTTSCDFILLSTSHTHFSLDNLYH